MPLLSPELKHLENVKIVLGSASPRRAELLRGLGLQFEIVTSNEPEIVPGNVSPMVYAAYLSQLKTAHLRAKLNPDDLLITADTVVIHSDTIMNKPHNHEEAFEMLSTLSGNVHVVKTGVTISQSEIQITKTDTAEVRFAEMTDIEINYYINTFQPFDRAGAYGIQDWIGRAHIEEIKGSFYTIMGLPTHLIYDVLKGKFRK